MLSIYTIGHSTRSSDELLALLAEHNIKCLVDVRRFPGSKRHPYFAREILRERLVNAGIDYSHEPDMGGFRKPRPDSPNTWWRAKGFQAYADHMDSPEFKAALERLVERAGRERTAIMCAEATPWKCHRQLISDALVARGYEVVHILAPDKAEEHESNPAARLQDDGRLVYREPPADQVSLFPKTDV